MKIGIVGAGQVGSRLGRAWAAKGHEIMFSSRTPDSERMKALTAETDTRAGTVAETLAFGEVVVVALHWDVLENVLPAAGDWKNKIVVDVTNRFIPPPPTSVGSAGGDLARMLNGAKVTKALNSIGAEHMADPHFDGGSATMFICGDFPDAKQTVRHLVEELGFEVVDIGWMRHAELVEGLAKLWIHLAYNTDTGRNVGFKLMKKP